MFTKRARKCFHFEEKCELINLAKKNPTFDKTQVNTILSKQESIIEQYESNVCNDYVLLSKRSRPCEFSGIKEALYKWHLLATTRNIYPSEPQLCEKARQIAEELGVTHFKASNGWLDQWKSGITFTR